MLYFKRRRRRFRKRMLILPLFILICVLLVRAFESKVSAFSQTYIPAFAERTATEAINDAVLAKLSELDFTYRDLAEMLCDENGKPQSVQINTVNINRLKAETTRAAQDELTKIKHSEIFVPLGAFTGFTLISNSGPDIRLTYCMTGSFNSRIESSFQSTGVNQSIHHLRLIVTAKIVTASVDCQDTMTFETDFELAQNTINGEIPTIYGGLRNVY